MAAEVSLHPFNEHVSRQLAALTIAFPNYRFHADKSVTPKRWHLYVRRMPETSEDAIPVVLSFAVHEDEIATEATMAKIALVCG